MIKCYKQFLLTRTFFMYVSSSSSRFWGVITLNEAALSAVLKLKLVNLQSKGKSVFNPKTVSSSLKAGI